MVHRLCRILVWSAHLAQEGLGWVERGEEEEEPGGEVKGKRGGDGGKNGCRGGEGGGGAKPSEFPCESNHSTLQAVGVREGGEVARWLVLGGHEDRCKRRSLFGRRSCNRGGGGGSARRASGAGTVGGSTWIAGIVAGKASRGSTGSSGMSEADGFLPRAKYQASPLFGLPRGLGIVRSDLQDQQGAHEKSHQSSKAIRREARALESWRFEMETRNCGFRDPMTIRRSGTPGLELKRREGASARCHEDARVAELPGQVNNEFE
jgi:hypothetical protein